MKQSVSPLNHSRRQNRTNKHAVANKRVHSFTSVTWGDFCACILSATLSSPSCPYEFPVFNLHNVSGFGSRVPTWIFGVWNSWSRLLFKHRDFLQLVIPTLLHTDLWGLPNETLSGIFLNKGLEPVKSSVHGRWGRHPIDSPVSWSLCARTPLAAPLRHWFSSTKRCHFKCRHVIRSW